MRRFSALYFPDTLPPPAAFPGPAALFAPLDCYRCLPEEGPPPSPWAELADAGLLQFHAPLETGPDHGRLQALLREIEGQRGEAALLFVQNLIARSSAKQEETAPELVGPLLGLKEDAAAARERESLWQALLLLKLAETLERGEIELEAELAKIETGRATLLRKLQGEKPEEEDAAPAAPAKVGPNELPVRPWRNSARLLRAWSHLFLRDRSGADLLLSADPEAWNILLERAAADNRPAVALACLKLPHPPTLPGGGLGLASEQAGTPAVRLPAPLAAPQQQLLQALEQAARTGATEPVAAAGTAWNQAVASQGAAAYVLDIMLLPQTPLAELVARCCPQAAPATKTAKGRGANPHGLIALYRPC
jgi:hypothetical protein